MKLVMDGVQVSAVEGQTLLDVARSNGIEIPTLCFHEAVEARGACRLCTVEIGGAGSAASSKLVASCVYPAEDGLVVRTRTAEIDELRRVLVDLLMARCPETEAVVGLGRLHGLEETTFDKRRDDGCILCGLCVRVCEEVIGAFAIGVSGRGAGKRVGPAPGDRAEACIGCGACAHVCPTGCIEVRDRGMTRSIPRWGVELELVPCRVCGAPVTTRQHVELVRRRVALGPEVLETCAACGQRLYATKVAAQGHM